MKKILSLILFVIVSLNMTAQETVAQEDSIAKAPETSSFLKIAYLSYETALKSMPEYATAEQNIDNLSKQYDAELKASEKEFNEKYELFLEQQSKLASAIREKRQSELQLMLERNVAFREESHRLLIEAEGQALAPLHDKLAKVLSEIGTENQYAIIVNTDNNSCPFINPLFSEDITSIVIERLKK